MRSVSKVCVALCATVLGAVAAPSVASAEIIEIGRIEGAALPAASCPDPCFVAARTTGYQAKVGATRGLMAAPKDGRIVAWSIALGKPGAKQTDFFTNNLKFGESEAHITILNPRRRLRARAVAQGEPMKLARYFGQTVQFPLEKTIPVKKGQVVALTVTTWAPVLAVNLGGDTSWRASRGKGTCDDTDGRDQTAQTQPNQLAQYYCLYRTARLSYSATLVTKPEVAKPAAARRR